MLKTLIYIVTLEADEKDFDGAESELRHRIENLAPGNLDAEVEVAQAYRVE